MKVAFVTDATIQKIFHGLRMTTLITSNKEMDESGLLKKIVNEKNGNDPDKQKNRLHGMLLATLGANL